MSILRGRRRAALILALVAAGATMLASPLVSSYAASPGMGVVSDSNRVASWTGAVTVPTGAGCKGAADPTCDNYKLTVQIAGIRILREDRPSPGRGLGPLGLRPRRRPDRELRQRPRPAGDRNAHESGGRYVHGRSGAVRARGRARRPQLYGERDAHPTGHHRPRRRPARRGSPTRSTTRRTAWVATPASRRSAPT